jgi:ribosomal protein L9
MPRRRYSAVAEAARADNPHLARKLASGVLFGSVTSLDVAEALTRRASRIHQDLLEDPLKQLGEFRLVRLHEDVSCRFPCRSFRKS